MVLDMAQVSKSAREIVANNLRSLMKATPDLNTQDKVAKKAGIQQRTVGYLLDPATTDMKSPKLDTVEAVARVFGLEPWILLVEPETFGEQMAKNLQRPAIPPSETLATRRRAKA